MMPPPDKIDRRWIFVNAEVILDHLAAALPPREDLDVQKVLCHRAVRRRAALRRHGCPNRAKAQIPSLMRCSTESRADLARDSPGYRSGSRGVAHMARGLRLRSRQSFS